MLATLSAEGVCLAQVTGQQVLQGSKPALSSPARSGSLITEALEPWSPSHSREAKLAALPNCGVYLSSPHNKGIFTVPPDSLGTCLWYRPAEASSPQP